MKKLPLFFILSFTSLFVFGDLNFDKYYPIYKDSKPIFVEHLGCLYPNKIKDYTQFFGLIKGLSHYINLKEKESIIQYQKIFEDIPLCSAKRFIRAFESVFCIPCNFRKHMLVNSAVTNFVHRAEVNSMRVFLKTVAKCCLTVNIKKTTQPKDLQKFLKKNITIFSKQCMKINNTYESTLSIAEANIKAGSIYDNGGSDPLFLAELKK